MGMFSRVKQRTIEAARAEAGHYEKKRSSTQVPAKPPGYFKYMPQNKTMKQPKEKKSSGYMKPHYQAGGLRPQTARMFVPPAFQIDLTPQVLTIEPVDIGLANNPNLHGLRRRV